MCPGRHLFGRDWLMEVKSELRAKNSIELLATMHHQMLANEQKETHLIDSDDEK